MKIFLSLVIGSFIVFFGSWFIVYKTGINSLSIQSEDTIPAIFLPVTLIKGGTLYADSYYEMIIRKYPHPDDKKYTLGLTPFYFKKIVTHAGTNEDIHYVSAFPLMAGIVSLPIYLIPVLLNIQITWGNLIILSHLSSSIILSLSGGLIYLLLRRMLSIRKAVLLSLCYLFCTINFPLISQALWQHGVLQLFTILTLLFLYRYKSSKLLRECFLAGLFFGLSVLSRPTAMFFLPFILLILLWFTVIDLSPIGFVKSIRLSVKPLLLFTLGILPSLLFFIFYNSVFFKDISNQGYSSQLFSNWLTPFPYGFLGLLFSPSKGIFVYSPIFVFIIFSLLEIVKLRRLKLVSKDKLEYIIFFLLSLGFLVVVGSWKHWYGGWSFGYRMGSDIIPFLILLLVPYINSRYFNSTKYLFYLSIVVSICVSLMGIGFFDGIWHGTYDKGFWDQSWLWSVSESETVFNIKRLLVKLSL